MRRVAITGVGLVTGLGTATKDTWNGLLEGRSAIGPIEAYNAKSLRTQLGAEIKELNGKEFVTNRRALRSMTHGDLIAVAAAVNAVNDSGLELDEETAADTALFVGSNKEVSDVEKMIDGITLARDEQGKIDTRRFGEEAFGAVPPLFYIEGLQASALFYVSDAFKLKGENTYFAGTAESSSIAIGRAFRAIRRGESDVAIAGGYDDPTGWWPMAKMDALSYMTEHNELGAAAMRPYDRDRDGTVMGDGGAFLILEEWEKAKARGAPIYAEVTGFGNAFDPGYPTALEPHGDGLTHAIESALREAGTQPDTVGYVAAHGSATPAGDASEAAAMRRVFGGENGLMGSSVKPATGNLMAGAGALNAAVAVLAIHHGAVPPTLNLEHEDPVCEAVDWVPGEAREVKPTEAIALARGFEGQNVALAMRAVT
jgi:3-oxoacyl-[acyl-carrier-protein] synthase II